MTSQMSEIDAAAIAAGEDREIAVIREAWKMLAVLDGRSRIRAVAYLIQLAVELPERDSDEHPAAHLHQSDDNDRG